MSFKPNDSRAIDEFCQEIIKITNCSKLDVYKFLQELTDKSQLFLKTIRNSNWFEMSQSFYLNKDL